MPRPAAGRTLVEVRVLFSSTAGYGHVLPMLPLAWAFRDAGHDVLWATARRATHLVAAAGLDTAPAGLAGAALVERDGVGCTSAWPRSPPPERAAFMFPRMFGEALTAPMAGTCCRSRASGGPTSWCTSTVSWPRPWSAPSSVSPA